MTGFIEHIEDLADIYSGGEGEDPLLVLERPGNRIALMRLCGVPPARATDAVLHVIKRFCPLRVALLIKSRRAICRHVFDGEAASEATAPLLGGVRLEPWEPRPAGDLTRAIERAVRRSRAGVS